MKPNSNLGKRQQVTSVPFCAHGFPDPDAVCDNKWNEAHVSRPLTASDLASPPTEETQKPNPFHGIDRYIFAFDEWGHRHHLNARGPLRWLCNWWDRRLWSRYDG